jgi:hypothetical protein
VGQQSASEIDFFHGLVASSVRTEQGSRQSKVAINQTPFGQSSEIA